MAPTAVVVNPGLDRSGLHICCDEPLSFTLCPGQLAWRSRNFRDSSGRQKQRSSKAAMASAADGIGGLGTEQTHVNVPVADPSAWATAMNNLGIMPMGLTGQQLVSDSICIQGFDPNLGIIAPINPMMAGISLVPPPPVQPELPVIKEIIHCKSCTLFPQNPNLPPPSTRERPPGCKTVFVGGLPENASEEIIREVFDQCGEIVAIRKSKKNFCHIRFSEEFMVDKAIYLSGYRMRIGSSTDKKDSGRIHVDFAQARDDLYEWECKQRLLAREERHRRKIQEDRLRPPSPPPIMHYSEHEAGLLAEKLKGVKRPLPGGACPEHLSRETSWRHPKQMPEPPQLPPFDVEEQRLYSELLPGDRAPYPISKGVPRHPTEEARFGRLYPGSYPFSHDPELMTIGDSRNID
ncbi:hypothetical protein QTP86_026593 [Hemibagrus guttatus]|nr:hypothetical protein QTP86_026593 [Hemibagrus guttatus]